MESQTKQFFCNAKLPVHYLLFREPAFRNTPSTRGRGLTNSLPGNLVFSHGPYSKAQGLHHVVAEVSPIHLDKKKL